MANAFDITIIAQYWLGTATSGPQRDVSSHGPLRVVVNGRAITDETFEYGASNTALALLRTLGRDHSPAAPVAECYPGCSRLVFHGCGTVPMIGCPVGVDWVVEHLLENRVRLSDFRRYDVTSEKPTATFSGLTAEISSESYRASVIAFAQEVNRFFDDRRRDLEYEYDRQEYEKYWLEFDELLKRHS